MSISRAQIRAARALLDWSRGELCKETGISLSAISNIEQGTADPRPDTLKKIIEVFESHGVEFTEGGVRERQKILTEHEGVEGFRTFMDDVYNTAKKYGGDICLFNTQPMLWYKHLGEDWYEMHNQRMSALGDSINVRIAIREGDESFILSSAQYRWFPEDKWKDRMYYAYGPKLALLNFNENKINIMVFNEAELADSFRILYDIAWEHETIPVK